MNQLPLAPQPVPEYRIIHLTKGQVAKVSASRFAELRVFSWFALFIKKTGKYYAARSLRVGDKSKTVLMHRQILGLTFGDIREGDHWNGDTLDNTDTNLRIATHAQNGMNRGKQSNNTSGHKNVTYDKRKSKWRPFVKANGKVYYRGRYDSLEAAVSVAKQLSLEAHQEFARI